MRFTQAIVASQVLGAGLVLAAPAAQLEERSWCYSLTYPYIYACSTTTTSSVASSTSASSSSTSSSTKTGCAKTTSTTTTAVSTTTSSSSIAKSTSSSSSSSSSSSASSASITTSQSSSSSVAASTSSASSTASSTSTSAAAAVTAVTEAVSGSWSYDFCAVEPFENGLSGVRALTGSSETLSTMTVEVCAAFCSGYSYFGVEYGSECYCGNSFSDGTTQDTAGGCSIACAGNALELCGGSGRMTVYSVSGAAVVSLPATYSATATATATSTATATATATASATAVATAGSYSYVSCATESFQNGASGRSLSADSTSNSTGMTVEVCAAYCGANGYTFFGVEYSSQCYCGNALATGTTSASSSSCNMACSGDSTELCGGSGVFGLYELTGSAVVTLPATYSVSATSTTTSSAAATTAAATTTSASAVASSTSSSSSSSSSSTSSATTLKTSTTSAAATTTSKASSTTSSISSTKTPCVTRS